MSTALVTGCGTPVFGPSPSCAPPPVYFSAQQTGTCPSDASGGPFTVPAGKFQSLISQSDADLQAILYLDSLLATCVPMPPVVTSATVNIGTGLPFIYQILATYSPVSYSATNLPIGLSLNTSTGLITGTITSTAISLYNVTISATNPTGIGNGTLMINVLPYLGLTFTTPGGGNQSPTLMIALDGGSPFAPVIGTQYNALNEMVLSASINATYASTPYDAPISWEVFGPVGSEVTVKASSSNDLSGTWSGGTQISQLESVPDSSGSFLSQYVANGSEFTSPVAIAKNGSSDIVIADGETRTGYILTLVGNGGVTYVANSTLTLNLVGS